MLLIDRLFSYVAGNYLLHIVCIFIATINWNQSTYLHWKREELQQRCYTHVVADQLSGVQNDVQVHYNCLVEATPVLDCVNYN